MKACVFVTCLGLGLIINFDAVIGKQRPLYEQYDILFVARCEAQCWTIKSRRQCVKACLLKGGDKPGQCPVTESALSPFDVVCLDTCVEDSQCPGLTKCCRHHCGITCQSAQGLQNVEGIPDIPTDILVNERRRKRTLLLKWSPGKSLSSGTVLYVIEERHHTGRHFQESRMGDWKPCLRTSKRSAIIRNLIKPGRWYQFRVAAVNENGTKGFSKNSLAFVTATGPKPPKAPQNVTVGPLYSVSSNLHAEMRWTAPPSDLPIQRYRVFWSRRLHGATALDSVLVHQQTVPKEPTTFLLKNLQPNSLYFLQVQAIIHYGREKLQSEKSNLILNTTNYTNATLNLTNKQDPTSKVEGLRFQKIYWSQGDLRARIVWKAKRKNVHRYTVSWWAGRCQNSTRDDYLDLNLAATTKDSAFDLYNLQFKCRYRVSVREVSPEGLKSPYDTSIVFITPTCKDVQVDHEKVKCS